LRTEVLKEGDNKLLVYVGKKEGEVGEDGQPVTRTLLTLKIMPAKHPDQSEILYMQVARDSNLRKVAAFVAKSMDEGKPVAIRACGPQAVSQALKATMAVREFVENDTKGSPEGTPRDVAVQMKMRMLENTREQQDAGRWDRFREILMFFHRAQKPPADKIQ